MKRLIVMCVMCVMCVVAFPASSLGASPGSLDGIVTDESSGVLPGVPVVLALEGGALLESVTDARGRYAFTSVPAGRHRLLLRLVNFADVRREVVVADVAVRADVVLHVALSADVTVTARRTFRNLAEAEHPRDGLMGLADSASVGTVTGRQIDARPLSRTGEILETVPGMVVSQHSGEGKANQYYLRGFNLDHGTDFATSVAGMPANMPTHAHGQGYADLSFVIPELVSRVQFRKGPYFAEQGDFSAAGAANLSYVSSLERPILRIAGGEDGWGRVLAAASPAAGTGRLLFALEAGRNDGPWDRSENLQRFSGVVRYSRGDMRNGWSLTGMGYRARWDASDQIPRRAVGQGLIGRFGAIDRTDGGDSSRYSASLEAQRGRATSSTHASAYAMRYGLDLFSNFTYFLDDPARGDQLEQKDDRFVSGGRVTHRRLARWGRLDVENAAGVEARHDRISVGLHRTQARVRHATVREDAVNQTSGGVFAQSEIGWTPWLRTVAGLRADAYRFDVSSDLAENSGQTSSAILSPKGAIVLGPWRGSEVYLNAGRGFHSNDARGATIRIDPSTGEAADPVTPLVRAIGAELGLRSVVLPRTQVTLAAWTLALDSELLFIGDAGTTDAGRPSRRSGVEISAVAGPLSFLYIDADLALSRARFTDESAVGSRVHGSVGLVMSAGVSIEGWRGITSGLRWRFLGGRPLGEDGAVRSRASGVLNGQASVAVSRRVRIGIEAFNLLDAASSDIDYFYVSRLRGEPATGIPDVHFHPLTPRALRANITLAF